MKSSVYYIYIIRCSNNLLYTGITTNLERRFNEHQNSTKGAKFTRANKPKSIEIVFESPSRSSASKLEYAIKKLPKFKKEALISKTETLNSLWKDQFNDITYHVINN